MICCCADEIGCEEEADREERRGAKMDGDEELERDDGESEVFCKRFVATKFRYLYVSLCGKGMEVPLDGLFVSIGDVSGEVLLGLPISGLEEEGRLKGHTQ